MKKIVFLLIFAVIAAAGGSGCFSPRIKLFSDASDPLKQHTLSGEGGKKVLVIPVRGVITDSPEEDAFKAEPSPVQEIVAQLDLARRDSDVGAVLLQVNSPGGSVTASDILYNEIAEFKEDTGVPVVASLMDVAASGAYYICLPADTIIAHPTTVTGSVGVVFMRPNFKGLMDKLGVEVAVNASGENKDMGSPFRRSTRTEEELFDDIVEALGTRFMQMVEEHRNLSGRDLERVASARIFLADQALEKGLVDRIGYLPDSIDRARKLANLPEDSRVVVYRRTRFADDNIYNPVQMSAGSAKIVDLGLPAGMGRGLTGFYYLWSPGLK